ncbi:hypothetical protein SERLADRAFT_389269, partial [Serpula lacrymans var. lacrymans S7.9]
DSSGRAVPRHIKAAVAPQDLSAQQQASAKMRIGAAVEQISDCRVRALLPNDELTAIRGNCLHICRDLIRGFGQEGYPLNTCFGIL